MPTIEFVPAGKTVEVPRGTDLLEAARLAGVEIELPCAGEGTCGRCIVRVTRGEVDSDSLGLLPDAVLAQGYVQACTARVIDAPLTVEVRGQPARPDGPSCDDDAHRLVDAALLPTLEDLDPFVAKWLLAVSPPQLEDGLSDLDRLTQAIRSGGHPQEVVYALPVLRAAAGAVRADGGRVTATVARAKDKYHVIRIEAGSTLARLHGIAVDVGTTTIAVQLVELSSGQILATHTDYNAQIACGMDVISRINYAARPRGLEELRTRVLGTINRLICEAAVGCSVSPSEISEAVVSGNTVMTHLLLGLEPEHIRLEPYTPTVLRPPLLVASQVGLAIGPDSPVQISPCVGSYLGGDITAGLLCTGLADASERLSLFIDVGTNGELVVGGREFLMGCACSAGPAFEGGGIGCGMRATAGAVEKVSVDPSSARPTCSTIGGALPEGICGSGMIDLLANLLRTGWIDRKGCFDRSRSSPFIEVEGKRTRYVIVPADGSATGRPIVISETDIENIIRAKAAIYSAVALMLHHAGLEFADLGRIYIAGSFGRSLDPEQTTLIGLTPDVPRDRFRYLGNASLTGSYMCLVSQRHRRRQLELARRVTYIELSADPAFMDQYTAALFLPHTDLGRFPSAAAAIEASKP